MAVLNLFQLSIYSLPFNIVVIMFLYILKFREQSINKPEVVVHQQFSPEKNLYSQLNIKERFNNFKYIPINLPFWGEWTITQAHHGKHTHKEAWAHAWDFEIQDEDELTCRNGGEIREDFYAYDKPIICPADGWIEEILDGVEDNNIGDSNLEQNWGNTVVVKHAEALYSKISHIKKDSFKVKKGDFVKKGDVLAHCGNSGRSPEPHIHFQIQKTPFIGSKTLDYPLGHYILHNNNSFTLKTFSRPNKGELISNISKNNTLYNAFHFVPGQHLKFQLDNRTQKKRTVILEVQTDVYNNTFLYCSRSKSKAWFKNDGSIHYFTHFEGNKNSLLFYFYLGAYKVITGFYKGLKITDNYPIHMLNNKGLVFFQDFIAPFYLFVKSRFELEYKTMNDKLTDSHIFFQSNSIVKHGSKKTRDIKFQFEVESNRIKKFTIIDGDKKIEANEEQTVI